MAIPVSLRRPSLVSDLGDGISAPGLAHVRDRSSQPFLPRTWSRLGFNPVWGMRAACRLALHDVSLRRVNLALVFGSSAPGSACLRFS